jgi:hypothetical protein
MSADLITIKVHLLPKAYEALEAASYAEALSRTDVTNRALQLYAAIGGARPGQVVTLTTHDGRPWKRVVVE